MTAATRRSVLAAMAAALSAGSPLAGRGGIAVPAAAQAAAPATPVVPAARGSVIETPMRDGTILRANLFLPKGDGPFPALLFRTPYSKDEGDPFNETTFHRAVDRGYALVVQDVRGRYASDGEFDPYRQEGKDGHDTIEWIAAQPWCDGRVGTFGLSYPGAVQWLAALESPPHLKAMVPAMCFSTVNHAVSLGGIFELEWLRWGYQYMLPDEVDRRGLDGPRTIPEAVAVWNELGPAQFQDFLPTLEMPHMRGAADWYYDWIATPPYDPAWDWGVFAGRYDRVTAAVLNLSAWHDEPYGAKGAIDNFRGLRSARAGEPDPRTKLILGPWIHGVDAVGIPAAGARSFDPGAALDYDAIVLDWLDLHVRGIETPAAEWPAVRAFVMGDDRWIEGDDVPLPGVEEVSAWLGRRDGWGVGTVTAEPIRDGEPATTYISDPADPLRDDEWLNYGAADLRRLLGRPDVATFETAPMAEDLEVIGEIRAELHVSVDAPDADLFVFLLDVAPDGTAFNLMGAGAGALRLSYRDASPVRALLAPGEIVAVTLPNLRTGNAFLAGHRLRMCVCSSWRPTYSPNLQTGELESVSAVMRVAAVTIHHDEAHPSRIVLPVRRGAAGIPPA